MVADEGEGGAVRSNDSRDATWTLVSMVGICAIALVAYANSLDVPFVFDDRFWIVDNPSLHRVKSWGETWQAYRTVPNRYVGFVSLVMNYRLGGLNVAGYHAFNLAVHVGTALAVFALVRLAMRAPRLRSSTLGPFGSLLAAISAAVFAAHPLQTQAVTYVIQRFASLATFLYLLSVVTYAWWRTRDATRPVRNRTSVVVGLALILLILGAMRTKEIAFTLPFAILLYEGVFFGVPGRRQWPMLALTWATLPVIPLTGMRSATTVAEAVAAASSVPGGAQVLGRTEYAWVQVRAIATYLRLWAFPVGQNVDHDIGRAAALFDTGFAISLAAILILAGAGACLWWLATRRQGWRADAGALLPAFGIGWFFLTISVECSFIPIPDVIAEHRMYLPSVGLSIVTGWGIVAAAARLSRRRTGLVAFGMAVPVVLVLAFATHARNELWRDELSLWTDAAAKSPARARPRINIASTLARRGNPEEALAHYRVAIDLDPEDPEVRNNMGIAYFKTNRIDEAILQFETAIRLDPGFGNAYYNLGIALGKKGRTEEAMQYMRKGLQLGSTHRH